MRFIRIQIIIAAIMLIPGMTQAADLQQTIDSAIAVGQKELIIAPGIYRLPAKPNQPQLLIKGAKGMAITADGVKVVATSLDQAVRIQDCEDLELRGLSIDYDPLPFTQGVITAKADDGTWMDVRIDAGYPAAKADAYKRAIIHDSQTGHVKQGTWTRFGVKIVPGADGVARISWPQPTSDAATVGDRVSLTQQVNTPHGLMIERSSNCTLRGVTVMASTSFGIFESHGGGNKYIECAVRTGPAPEGATATRLLSSNADGLHSKRATRGPLIENCTLDSMGDDGIAINGEFVLVAAADGDRLIVSPQNQMPFSVGDRLHGISHAGLPTDDAKIVSITPLKGERAPNAKQIQMKAYPNLRLVDNAFKNCFEVTLDRTLPVKEGDLAASPDRNGSNFVVRHNVVRNTRARGILIKASYGVIEKNQIEDIALAGVVLCPETKYWHEADYSTDVAIRENVLRHVLTAPTNAGMMQAGAMTVCSEGDGKQFAPAGGHRAITIEKNRIEEAPGTQIMITSAKDVTVRGNTFVNPKLDAGGNGASHGVDSTKVVWVTESENVAVRENVEQK